MLGLFHGKDKSSFSYADGQIVALVHASHRERDVIGDV